MNPSDFEYIDDSSECITKERLLKVREKLYDRSDDTEVARTSTDRLRES